MSRPTNKMERRNFVAKGSQERGGAGAGPHHPKTGQRASRARQKENLRTQIQDY